MNGLIAKKLGAGLVVSTCILYGLFRILSVSQSFSIFNLAWLMCEVTLAALVSVESTLLATRTKTKPRKQDEAVLLESAKSVLFSKSKETVQTNSSGAPTIIETEQIVSAGTFKAAPIDVVVFAEEATLEQLRRSFLSLDLMEDNANVYVIDATLSPQREELAKEFSFHVAEFFHNITATTANVLICRGTDIFYPDALKVARSYETNDRSFLELRSVYSDERALGVNGVVEVSDKRQMIRESLSTRGLATWSTGPALVNAKILENSANATTAAQFFRACEINGVHGQITEEIVSEEISHEQTISEVEWRALDFSYSAGAWRNSYRKGSRRIGLGIKTWSMMINASFIRRVAWIALLLAFVISPNKFSFLNFEYLSLAVIAASLVFVGGIVAGDRRGPFARIREYYFDVEAVMYSVYKSLIKPEKRASDSSIVKKLPSVSALLIATDAVLVFRVVRQYKGESETIVSSSLKNLSLFAGYGLLVSLLIGLGMVIVRQARTAIRREISRGANLNSEPVSMIDLSPGGAGCISVNALEIGSTITFESSLPSKTENTKFKCDAIVRSSVAWNDSFRIGIEFVDLDQKHFDTLETYCSIVYPHAQARESFEGDKSSQIKLAKLNGVPEKRFLSYAASFIALGAIVFSNVSNIG